jgi:2-polyprenyl-6-hydroxyphenyl methylase/3-demethylubiquinone-9 3-methyltransferase
MQRLSRCRNDFLLRLKTRSSTSVTLSRQLSSWIAPASSASRLRCVQVAVAPILLVRTFSSVSAAEITKFSELSKTWWDPRENPLIGMNTIRVEYILANQILSASGSLSPSESESPFPFSGLKALDVGCGGGLLSESLARLGASVTAIDPSKELVEQAQRHSQLDPRTRSIDYRGGWTVEQLAAAEEESSESESSSSSSSSSDTTKFDVICLLEVIEHVTDVDSILSSIRSLLKPDGKVFLSTLNRTAKSKIVAIVGAEYVMRYLPIGTHDWNQFRSPEEVRAIVEQNGLEEVDVKGMVLASPPFLGQWNWRLDAKDTDINWIGTYQLAQ